MFSFSISNCFQLTKNNLKYFFLLNVFTYLLSMVFSKELVLKMRSLAKQDLRDHKN